MSKQVVCFDLDDTLYKEIYFLESAYRKIASSVGKPEILPLMVKWFHEGENVFQKLNQYLGLDRPITEYLTIYRNHIPNITLSEGVEETLNELAHRGVTLGIITDGRSISQRNKICSLGLSQWFENDNVIISEEFGSEKTNQRNFLFFTEKYPKSVFSYIGDNPKKDFIVPNSLGWKTVMLKDDGNNIHKQIEEHMEYLPQFTIDIFEELLDFIK